MIRKGAYYGPGRFLLIHLLACLLSFSAYSQTSLAKGVKTTAVGLGWTNNSVNTVIFRKNSLVTHHKTQYLAYYDPEQYLVLAKRTLPKKEWEIQRTAYKGNTMDAHNAISIMVDGDGYLHVSWDHHNDSLRYARSLAPGSLQLSEKMPMTGSREESVTYPEFYRLPNGELLFFYRYGASGNGNLVINKYDLETKEWTQLQHNLLDGEGERNAYWQAFVDEAGTVHLSWVWRESWDVASNHDLCYARSRDGGQRWENSRGEKYSLPITQKSAEVALEIPQNSELINQTSMTADGQGNPVIATYWKAADTEGPGYQVVYHDGNTWNTSRLFVRKTSFSLSGGGTKKIPISRPQVMIRKKGKKNEAIVVFRDQERGDKVSVARNRNFPVGSWEISDLNTESLGAWEPSFDTELWKQKGILHLFVQKVVQLDGEGVATAKPEMISVLEWKPLK